MAAVVGGVVGAGVVMYTNKGTQDLSDLELTNLTVSNLVIKDQALLLNKEGVPEIVLREGSVLAENVILAKKLVGRQLQGHAIVANRVFTTPDDLIATPMENWRFFAEIGASHEAGGEIVIRSTNGAASVNRPTVGGALLRAGFDTDAQPQIIALQNQDRRVMPIRGDLSEQQRQMLMAGSANPQAAIPQGSAGFDSNAAAPITNYNPSGDMIPVATQPSSASVQ